MMDEHDAAADDSGYARRGVLQRLAAVAAIPSLRGGHRIPGRSTGRSGLAAGERTRMTDTRTVVGGGYYEYVPFEVPSGVNEVAVTLSTSRDDAAVGVGLFDHRGAGYQSSGFRGVYGAERSSFYVRADDASQSFLPRPVDPGTWTVVVPVFEAPVPTEVTVAVTLTFGSPKPRAPAGPTPGIVSPETGWYAGDLHCHTPASSDAWSTGTALTAPEWADACRERGLDFVSLTDHNVVSQNRDLKRAAANGEHETDVLLVGGEEMTNWFHGHATVTGLDPGEWLDWRQRPLGAELDDHEARIQAFIDAVDAAGAYAAVAHPALPLGNNDWDFWADAAADPAARPHGIEVWNGPWTPEDEAALAEWDRVLGQGWRLTASGGSDTHGTDDPTFGQLPGVPTTYVYAEELSPDGIVTALKRGRAFLTRDPEGPALFLEAEGPDDRAMVGGEVHGSPVDVVTFSVKVRDGAGMRLRWLRDGEPVAVVPVTSAEATLTLDQPVGTGGYVRVELRGEPSFNTGRPRTSRGDMAALTNPVFLVGEFSGDDRVA